VKILDYIFCDDIRFEQRGKYSLSGLYQDSINIETKNPDSMVWPIFLRLGVFLRLKLESEIQVGKEYSFSFELFFNEKSMAMTNGKFSVHQAPDVILGLPMGPYNLNVDGPGNFSFVVRISLDGEVLAVESSPFKFPIRVRKV